ncbi:MAG: malonic semialdehyde reductase [Alphaproteobacteria bacterium]|nr:malonic semialdehyde reductase [Alphaproteobacteria bacterium]
MPTPLDAAALDLLFRTARTHRDWLPKPVSRAVLVEAYELARLAPTSANCSPMRIVFVISPAAKARLCPCLSSGNVAQTMAAPATAIIAHDTRFYDLLPRLYRAADARPWFADDPAAARATAARNGGLQGAYFILAARACGLDCGPMSGFDNAKVDAAFFPDGRNRGNFLCNLGYGDPKSLRPRDDRLAFDEACALA